MTPCGLSIARTLGRLVRSIPESAAERIRQQFFRERANEAIRVCQQPRAQPLKAIQGRSVGQG